MGLPAVRRSGGTAESALTVTGASSVPDTAALARLGAGT